MYKTYYSIEISDDYISSFSTYAMLLYGFENEIRSLRTSRCYFSEFVLNFAFIYVNFDFKAISSILARQNFPSEKYLRLHPNTLLYVDFVNNVSDYTSNIPVCLRVYDRFTFLIIPF